MNIREQIKRRVTFEQRRHIIRVWVGFRARFAPGRIRARNLPKLPNRRKWRNALLWSCQGGTLTYQYRDIPMLKQAFEVALYMRLIWETKPGTIIEIGSHSGGAAVWMSDLLKTRFGPSTGRLIAATARCEIVGGLSRVSSTNHVGMSATGPRLSHAYCCASAFTDGGATTMPPSPRTSISGTEYRCRRLDLDAGAGMPEVAMDRCRSGKACSPWRRLHP